MDIDTLRLAAGFFILTILFVFLTIFVESTNLLALQFLQALFTTLLSR
jgi:hypothetical protein